MTRSGMLVLSAVWLAGCAVELEPLQSAEVEARVTGDRKALAAYSRPVFGPLTMSQALARALVFNLTVREALARRDLAQATFHDIVLQTLPRLDATERVTTRSNDPGETGDLSPSDRTVRSGDISFTWSILDFGVGYLRAKQAANDTLIAEEGRRRVANEIFADVISAYLSAANAERYLIATRSLMGEMDRLVARAQELSQTELEDPLVFLKYQWRMIGLKEALAKVRERAETNRLQLAALINAPVDGVDFAPYAFDWPLAELGTLPLDDLETFALRNRSELREADYRSRNARLEIWTTYTSLVPSIVPSASQSRSSDSALLNSTWYSFGLTASYNLFNLLRFPARLERAERNVELENVKRLALAVGVLEQVRLSIAALRFLEEKVELAKQKAELRRKIVSLEGQRSYFAATDELHRFESRVRRLVAQVEYDQLRTEYLLAYVRLLVSLGVDLFPDGASVEELDELVVQIERHLRDLPQQVQGLILVASMTYRAESS